MTALAWHFCGPTLHDGSPIPADGVVLRHDGPLKLCESGLHWSENILDALKYAPGNTVCCVRVGGEIVRGDDKGCSSERTILWRIDGEKVLRLFARRCALDMAHLWDMPLIVCEYLETGDEGKREAATTRAEAATTWAEAVEAAEAATTWAEAVEAVEAATWAEAAAAARAEVQKKQNELLTQMVIEEHEKQTQGARQ